MDFKSLLSQLDQLNEATTKTKTGIKHTAEPGGYGRKDDEDDEGNKVKAKDTEKKGRGRPKKATQSSGEDKKYDFSAFGVKAGKDVKLPKWDKKKTKKHSIKEYLDQMDKALNEDGYTTTPMPGAVAVKDAAGKVVATAKSPAAAEMFKKGEVTLGNPEEMHEEDIGKHNNATTGFDALVRKLTPKYGKAAALRIAGAQLKKIKEADQPPRDALASPLTLEAKKAKPDFLDMDKDGNKKETMKKAVSDKKKVKEGMDQRLNAARSEGKAHGLRGHAHCGKNYEDMEEARCYHEGYKEGLDECYGQMPIQGYVGETESGADVVNTMASYGAEEGELAEADIEESPFSWAAKNTPKGEKFKLGGKEFVKNDAFAFESLEKQLNALLESKEDVAEGMTVSISKGQQGSPDSVSINAQDAEADELLSFVKQAGLGIFGGDDAQGQEPMTVDHGGEPAEIGAGGDAIEVVGDHDGMMSLMKKLSGIGGGEESHSEEETCETCGESACGCDDSKEVVDEVESEDQMTYQMAEDNPPDSGEAEEATEIADTQQANAAAAAYNPSQDIDEGGDGGEASDVGNVGVEAGDADEEMQASMNEEDADEKQKDGLEESSFANLYKKLAMLSEESTAEKDDKAEKAAKKVAKDIEYDEDHKGKDDDQAEEAGKKVKKDIEYDDKKDKKEKKLDEWANDAGKKGTDTTFETDIDFMMNVISGGLNKRKQTGQTTIPVIANQVNRTVSSGTTDINESVSDWKKLAGLK
jgi:hypothetical protein